MEGDLMMKKLVFFVFIPFILLITFANNVSYQAAQGEEHYQVIPDEAIRLRILANSDNEADQEIKYEIRNKVSDQITEWVEHLTSIEEARNIIKSRLPEINRTVNEVLAQEKSSHSATVDYGENITFPIKKYDSYIYPPGEYEAVLITIGEGKGANWWCVLFPPLCFLDFSHGSVVAENQETVTNEEVVNDDEKDEEEEETVKVKFFLFEWFGWT